MTRLCERPGCSDRAEVAYGFDADQLTVWLDAFAVAQGARSGVLCRRHADAMVVPIGWSLDDRREPVPRLFRPAAQAGAPATAPTGPRRRPARRGDTEQLQLEELVDAAVSGIGTADEAVIDSSGAVEPGTDIPTAAAPWMPQFDQDDDLAGLLKARGPLLSRAFGGRSRPSET